MKLQVSASALLSSILLFSAPCAIAQDDCANAKTDAAMRTCEIARYDSAQQELAAVVQTLSQKLDAANRQRFKNSQTTWLSYRTANAAFVSQLAGGGTLTPLLKETVLADMTAARAKELRQDLKP